MEFLAKQDIKDGNLNGVTAEITSVGFTAVVSAIQAYSATLNTTRYTLGTLSHDIRNLINVDITFATCTNAANDGTFRVVAVGAASGYVYVQNMNGVLQAGAAGTVASTFVLNALHTQPIGAGVAADEIQGNILHDTADGATKPVKIGGKASAALPAAVGDGDRVNAYFDLNGRLVTAGMYSEDAAHTTGDLGLQSLAVRNDAATALATTDGDYAPTQVNAAGAVITSGYDVSLDLTKTAEQSPVWSRYTSPVEILSGTPYELTAAFADVGGEQSMLGYNQITLYIDIDINTSTDVELRVLFKHESAGAGEYREIYLGNPASNSVTINLSDYMVDSDADQKFKLTIPTGNGVPYIQLQAKDAAAGTGQIETLYVVKSWSA